MKGIGELGENIAAQYLTDKGYEIITRNWRMRRWEIDIIARHKKTIVFVEVRAKTHERRGTPEETITFRKKKRLIAAARAWIALAAHDGLARIDAVCMVINTCGGIRRLKHYENIAP